jgi:hypothetical protein
MVKEYRVHGCIDHGCEIEGLVDNDRAKFWSVYEVCEDGTERCIADFQSMDDADMFAMEKSKKERVHMDIILSVGRKDDTGKPRMGLLPFDALGEVAKVLTYGATKYAPDNWKKVPDGIDRYTDAFLRHLAVWRHGEVFDPESQDIQIRHIAQVACNALFLVWFELYKEKKNG